MANYKGHITGGILANAAYLFVLTATSVEAWQQASGMLAGWQFIIALFVVAVLFALWPDVDTNSKGQNIFYSLAFFADVLLIATGRIEAAAYLGLLAMTPVVGKHRGWTHSKLAMLLVPLPIVLVPYLYRPSMLATSLVVYGAAVAGYFSHLLFDGLIIKRFRVKGNRYG